jgi:hypothetical protein
MRAARDIGKNLVDRNPFDERRVVAEDGAIAASPSR